MTKILIVEDEIELAELIALYCENEGWQTLICGSAEEAQGALKAADFSLITLDINLPGIDGFEFLKKTKSSINCPVLIISARESDDEIISGLELGANEYVTKPFAPKVLMARIHALLRPHLTRESSKSTEQYSFGEYILEPDSYSLKRNNERINLSTREFDILILLSRALGSPVNAYDILEQVWGNQTTEPTAVGVYIQRIRKKLQTPDNDKQLIETVHGRGYCLNAIKVGN
jgi:two-component system response regulator RegX3